MRGICQEFTYRKFTQPSSCVYTIVLFEHSPAEFKKFPGTYYHCFEQKFDIGIEIDFLQICFIIHIMALYGRASSSTYSLFLTSGQISHLLAYIPRPVLECVAFSALSRF